MENMYKMKIEKAYTAETIKSMSDPSWSHADWKAIGAEIKDGTVVCWLHHTLLFGKIAGGVVSFLEEKTLPDLNMHLVRLRAFNTTKEIHLWRSGQKIKGRLREDMEGEGTPCIDTDLFLWGKIEESTEEGYVRLKEDRGWDKLVPLDNNALKGDVLTLKTRNYIGYDEETCQAGYVDSRFVSIHP